MNTNSMASIKFATMRCLKSHKDRRGSTHKYTNKLLKQRRKFQRRFKAALQPVVRKGKQAARSTAGSIKQHGHHVFSIRRRLQHERPSSTHDDDDVWMGPRREQETSSANFSYRWDASDYTSTPTPGSSVASTPTKKKQPTHRPSENVDENLIHKLRNPEILNPRRSRSKKRQVDLEETGKVYLFNIKCSLTKDRAIKVGVTKDKASSRGRRIQRECKHDELTPTTGAAAYHTPHADIAESLIKTELKPFSKKFICDCQTRHEEYYDLSQVPQHHIIEVFHRWRRFCALKPWDTSTGQMSTFWMDRLHSMHELTAQTEEQDFQTRAKLWRAFSEPSWLDRLSYDLYQNCSAVGMLIFTILLYVSSLALLHVHLWTRIQIVALVALLSLAGLSQSQSEVYKALTTRTRWRPPYETPKSVKAKSQQCDYALSSPTKEGAPEVNIVRVQVKYEDGSVAYPALPKVQSLLKATSPHGTTEAATSSILVAI